MTISVATTLSLEVTSSELLKILIKLHQKKFANLHISYNENKKLVIHSEDEMLGREMMHLIDTDKAGAIAAHFKNTYFTDVACEIFSVTRPAFLPRSTTSLASLVESAVKVLLAENQNANALLALERMRSINARQAFVVPAVGLLHSDLDPNLNSGSHVNPAIDVERCNQALMRETEMAKAQKSEKRKQNMIYEAQLIGLYHAVIGAAVTTQGFPHCELQISQIPCPGQATSRETIDSRQIGVTLGFTTIHQSHENLIMADIDSIVKKLLEETELDVSVMRNFHRDAMHRIISFELVLMGLSIAPQSVEVFADAVKKSLYLTGTEAHYRFSGFTLTMLPQMQQVAIPTPRIDTKAAGEQSVRNTETNTFIKVNIAPVGRAPWYWMALLSCSYPGQYYGRDASGEYVIFSGRNLPENITEIADAINQCPHTSSCIGPRISGVEKITVLPVNTQPFFMMLYQEAIQNMLRVVGRSVESGKMVEQIIRARFQNLLRVFQNPVSTPDPELFFLLEATAFSYLRMGNTIANGDIGRPTHYVSSILLRDTTSAESLTIPAAEDGATIQVVTLSVKPDRQNVGSIKDASEKLTATLFQRAGIAAHAIPDGDKIKIVMPNQPIIRERDRAIFLEKIRTAFYETALDGNYNLSWTASVVHYDLSASAGDVTDDEEERKLIDTANKIARAESLNLRELQRGWVRTAPRQRTLFLPGVFGSSAQNLTTELRQRGFSTVSGRTEQNVDAVQVTLRAK